MVQMDEAYISVDVETAGPNPGNYSMLSIGACSVAFPQKSFYVELQPVSERFDPEAEKVHGISMKQAWATGLPPVEAMERFETWLSETVGPERQPIFVAFNAPFDWMFVCDYFLRFLGRNPFGHTALDIKAFYMGLKGVPWNETTMSAVSRHYDMDGLSHHALDDAKKQASIFRRLLQEA